MNLTEHLFKIQDSDRQLLNILQRLFPVLNTDNPEVIEDQSLKAYLKGKLVIQNGIAQSIANWIVKKS